VSNPVALLTNKNLDFQSNKTCIYYSFTTCVIPFQPWTDCCIKLLKIQVTAYTIHTLHLWNFTLNLI